MIDISSDKPQVSIVLATFNGSRYLAQSIQSVIDQTFTGWEMIIVDDGSTDSTPEIIADFVAKDARIRSVRHATNKQLPTALNTGFALAKGEYLTWTSDDNLYRPDAVRVLAQHLRDHPSIGLVYSDYSVIDDSGVVTKRVEVPHYREHLHRSNCIGPSFMYRRTVYETVGEYDPEMVLVEDYDYWLRVSASHLLVDIREDLYLYRVHMGSLSSNRQQETLKKVEQVIDKNIPSLQWLSGVGKGEAYFRLYRRALNRGDIRSSLHCLVRFFLYSPRVALRRTASDVLRRLLRGRSKT